jgi:hypothetical protein
MGRMSDMHGLTPRVGAVIEIDQAAVALVDRRDLAEHALRGGTP